MNQVELLNLKVCSCWLSVGEKLHILLFFFSLFRVMIEVRFRKLADFDFLLITLLSPCEDPLGIIKNLYLQNENLVTFFSLKISVCSGDIFKVALHFVWVLSFETMLEWGILRSCAPKFSLLTGCLTLDIFCGNSLYHWHFEVCGGWNGQTSEKDNKSLIEGWWEEGCYMIAGIWRINFT